LLVVRRISFVFIITIIIRVRMMWRLIFLMATKVISIAMDSQVMTRLLRNLRIKLSGCLYHARRRFVEIIKVTQAKEGVAHDVLLFITKLAKIEEEIKELSTEDKFNLRLEKAKPILDDLHVYLVAVQPRTLPKSPLGQAVSYTLNQWPKLLTYLEDGRLENNNNRSERAIKPFVIGCKGWLFADSVAGAEAAAIIFSLVETCKHHGIEAYDWFRYVLQQLPLCQSDAEVEALMSFNINSELLTRQVV
jgi:transposase